VGRNSAAYSAGASGDGAIRYAIAPYSPGSGLAVAVTVVMVVVVMIMRVTMVMRVAVPMTVMFMTVIMIMIMTVFMATTVPVMFMTMVMIVIVMVAILVPMRTAVFGLERRRHHRRLEAAFAQKLGDRGVRRQAQAVGEDLHGNVAVAQRQHQPRRLGKILLAHLEHRLDIGDHFDEMAVVEHQEIVGAQQRRDREIEFDADTLAAEHEALLLDAVLEFEQHGVDDFAGALIAGAENFLGAGHGAIRFGGRFSVANFQWRVGRPAASAPDSNGTTGDGRSGFNSAASTLPASSARESRRACSR
jgi:hypothetical protein